MMPNWSYLILHFFHTMALALWIGGSVSLGALAAPVVFRLCPDRNVAGEIMGRVFHRFESLLGACALTLVVTSGFMIAFYGRLSPWYAIEYVCIGMMTASLGYSALIVGPRLRRLRSQGRSSTTEFERLHRTSELAMQLNLACATVALFFS